MMQAKVGCMSELQVDRQLKYTKERGWASWPPPAEGNRRPACCCHWLGKALGPRLAERRHLPLHSTWCAADATGTQPAAQLTCCSRPATAISLLHGLCLPVPSRGDGVSIGAGGGRVLQLQLRELCGRG